MKLQELKTTLHEARQPGLTYKETKVKEVLSKVTLELTGANSAVATKLAKRYERLDRTAKMLKEKRDELNAKVKGVGDELFNAEDVLITRVIQTVSFTMMLTAAEKAEHKKPKQQVDYEAAFKALSALVPDLQEQAQALLKAYTTIIPPKDTPTALKVAARVKEDLNEGMMSDFMKKVKSVAANLMSSVKSWATGYDKELNALKKQFKV